MFLGEGFQLFIKEPKRLAVLLVIASVSFFIHFSPSIKEAFGGFLADSGHLFKEAFLPESKYKLAGEFHLNSEKPTLDQSFLVFKEKNLSGKTYPNILIAGVRISPLEERFIKLYNPNDFDIDLTGWYIQRKTKTGGSFSSFVTSTNFEGKKIKARDYFLIAGPESYLTEEADMVLQLTLTSSNSLRLRNPGRENSDEVGYGEASNFLISPAPEPGENEILVRKKSSGGEYKDTRDNSNDFEIIKIFKEETNTLINKEKEEESIQKKEPEEENFSLEENNGFLEVEYPKISLGYPVDIETSKEFEASLSVYGLPEGNYDVKISIYNDDFSNLSHIYNKEGGSWQSSFFYLQNNFSGNTLEERVFKLRIMGDYKDFEGNAEIGVRIRKAGKGTYFEKTFPVFVLANDQNNQVPVKTTQSASGGGGIQPKEKGCLRNSVEINSASLEDLKMLQGVGSAIAEIILKERPFFNLLELERVSGIGEVKLQNIKDQGCAYIDEGLLPREESKDNDEEKEEGKNKVEINSAEKNELEVITGIGPVYAERIFENKPFCSIDDLIEIDGIGEKTIENIKEQGVAYVEPPDVCFGNNEEKQEDKTEKDLLEEGYNQEDNSEGEKKKIEVNSATKKELILITGIGSVYAERIIETRPFCSIDEMIRVSGIGNKTIDKIKEEGVAYINTPEFCRGENHEEVKEDEEFEDVEQDESTKEEIININSASLEELQKIKGIGPTIAQRIFEARPFSSFDDLLGVKGIGESTLNNIKEEGIAYIGE